MMRKKINYYLKQLHYQNDDNSNKKIYASKDFFYILLGIYQYKQNVTIICLYNIIVARKLFLKINLIKK